MSRQAAAGPHGNSPGNLVLWYQDSLEVLKQITFTFLKKITLE